MLHTHLITQPAPPLQLSDTVQKAIYLLEDTKCTHWPVVQEGLYLGMLQEDSLLEADEDLHIEDIQHALVSISALTSEHYLTVAGRMAERRLSLLPVTTDEGEYLGVIESMTMLQQLAQLTGAQQPGGLVVMECDVLDFSPGEISRLVETNDAQIRQLNTQFDEVSGKLIVTIRINKQEVSDIIATLQRYDFRVLFFAGEETYENELRRNYHHLLHYLEM